jgi:hypothetical protein
MGKPDPAATVARELKLLFRSYPDVSLDELASALQPPSNSAPPPGDSWENQVAAILSCASAFGNARLFASKKEALEILSTELGVPTSWTNLTWGQLPSVAAAALLRHGPAKASELMQRYQFPATGHPATRRNSRIDETVAATVGIINAKHT